MRFDERGLVPCVIQDWRSGEVLTLAYMNEEALRLSRETGELHLFSRSRNELWHKGATSGQHTGGQGAALRLRHRRRARARRARRPRLPHRRAHVLLHRRPRAAAPYEALPGLERTLRRPRATTRRGLLHGQLLADPPLIGEKVQEEAEEVVRAAREESDERVAEEAADVLYHLAVLLRSRGLSLADAEEVLVGRRR